MGAGCVALKDFGESLRAVPQPTKIKETYPVSHTALLIPNFYQLLLAIDADHAEQVRAAGCSCGGALHVGDFPRKPRGGPPWFRNIEHWRLSFCCARCRLRHTPRSVLYLGRRVYVGAVVVLGSALRSTLSGRALQTLCATLGVPRSTLDRWRAWWATSVPATPFWCAARADFAPPVALPLPADLLTRFQGADEGERLRHALRFVRPLSTVTEGR